MQSEKDGGAGMTFEQLREEARKQGYRLVHRDCIRTATVSRRITKRDLHQYETKAREVMQTDLRHAMADFLIRHSMADIQELPHEWDVEFRADLTVLAPRSPDPNSQEHFLYMPRTGDEVKP